MMNMDSAREEDLPRLLASDLNAYFPLMDQCFRKRLFDYALNKLRCLFDDIEDLMQETFRKAYRAMASYSAEEVERIHLWSWLCKILHNCFVDLWRRQNRQQMVTVSWGTEVSEMVMDVFFEQPERVAEQREFRQRVHALLERLDPAYREPLKLRHIDGLSCSEIAHRLQIPIATVNGHIAYGKKKLLGVLSDLGYDSCASFESDLPGDDSPDQDKHSSDE
jgi:RNA polymerase sigma factor (sigma-70 family)